MLNFVLQNRLNDKMNVYDYFLNRSNVLQRVNQHIVAQSTVHNLCGKGTAPAAAWKRERERERVSYAIF